MKSIAHLSTTPEQLKQTCLEQSQIIEQLISKNDAALKEAKEKNTTIEDQEKKIAVLEEMIRYLKHQKFGKSSERHTSQLTLFNECEQLIDQGADEEDESGQLAEDDSEHTSQDEIKPVKKRGRRKLPAHLPRIKQYHSLDELQTQCECGCQMEAFDEIVSEQLGIIPAKLYVIQHCRLKYRCKACETGIKAAPLPAQPIPKSNASPELLAHSIVAKFLDGLPFYRQETIWERMDVALPRATLVNWAMQSGGTLIQPLINLLIEHQMSGKFLNIDETTVQVLKEPDKPPEGKKYFWITVGGARGRPVCRFHYDPSRGTQVAKMLLDNFQGTVMSDDWHIYTRACESLSLQHIACNDHARRKYNDAIVSSPKNKKNTTTRVDIGIGYYQKLYAIEKRIRLNGNLPVAEITQIRQTESLPIWNAFIQWIEKTLPHIVPESKLGKALNYTYKLRDKLMAYCHDGNLPISNERAENAIRPFAIARKNFLFFDSPKGAKASENHYSLIMTAKMNGLDPFYYLAYVFKMIPSAQTVDDIEALLPWNVDNEKLKSAFDFVNGGV